MISVTRRLSTRTLARGSVVATLVAVAAVAAAALTIGVPTAHATVDGSNSDCNLWLDSEIFGHHPIEVAEEGWVWTNGQHTTDKFREAEGVATESQLAYNDTPANHYSHDWNIDVRVDDQYRDLVSDVNHPDTMELEWEIGVKPNEKSGDGASPFFPRWVFPNPGDRVWTDGHWVFDCGHFTRIDDVPHFRTEIHPPRAVATMRQQALPLPGSGTTPVPVTATDLYIHGAGPYMVQQLECGIDIILFFGDCSTKTTPINRLYTFEICLPPQPVPSATLIWDIIPGHQDSGKGADPELTKATATAGCKAPVDEFLNDFDDGTMLTATIDLRGTGITPSDIYARKIIAGWVYPPATPLPHLSLKLKQLDLHEDLEADPFDGEFTFWWMGVDRAPEDEWYRLSNYDIPTYSDSWSCFEHTNTLNDMDDDHLCGDGLLDFNGPDWTFYLRHGQPVSIFSRGFEQDCYDDHFGTPFFIATYVDCHFGNVFLEFTNDWGNNDPIKAMEANVNGPGLDPLTLLGDHTYGTSDFDFDFNLAQIPLANEDDADLGVTKTCRWEGEVAQAGRPFSCSIVLTNAGPGLPRNVNVTDTVTTSVPAADYTVGAASFHTGTESTSNPCGASTAGGFSCAIGTVPVGGSVTIDVQITPRKPGKFTNKAAGSTDSTDAVAANDSSEATVDVFLPVPVDIKPGSATNPLNLSKNGLVSVAILTTSTFDATRLAVATACFGDAEDPAQRTCSPANGVRVEDVDKDKDKDLVIHYEATQTGIDLGDTQACLKGTTTGGTGFFGCDVVLPQ